MVESQEQKKAPKYQINSVQRKFLISRIYPILLLGSIIWLSGEYLFSFLFSDIELKGSNLIYYTVVVIIEAILFVLFFFTAKNKKTLTSLFFFIILCFIFGILSLPIVILTEFIPQVHMFVSLSVGAGIIINFMTIVLRDNFFSKGYIWVHILLFIAGCVIVEIVFIFFFNIQNFLLSIPISLAYILIISLILIFFGVRIIKTIENENWIYILFKILAVLLVALVLAIIVVAIVLLIIACAIATDGAFDLSGFGGGGSSGFKRKKKRQQQTLL
jgi:hypothetical protein